MHWVSQMHATFCHSPPNGQFHPLASCTFHTSRGGTRLRWKRLLGALCCVTHKQCCELRRDLPAATLPHPWTTCYAISTDEQARLHHTCPTMRLDCPRPTVSVSRGWTDERDPSGKALRPIRRWKIAASPAVGCTRCWAATQCVSLCGKHTVELGRTSLTIVICAGDPLRLITTILTWT